MSSSTAVVPKSNADQGTQLPALALHNPFDITAPQPGQGVWTSLPLDTDQGKRLAMVAATGACEPLANHIGEVIEVKDVLVHGVDLADQQTGEISTHARVVIFGPDGAAYQAVSEGIIKALRYLASLYGPPSWSPALKLIPRQLSTKGGRRYFTLEVAPEKKK